jgi:hypothetical protein
MSEPRNHLPLDLKALGYLEALNAGDLNAVADLWEEASRDEELERVLIELESALYLENTELSRNGITELLPGPSAKRQPNVPPAWPWRTSRGRRALWGGAISALAAACLLAALIWSRRDRNDPLPDTVNSQAKTEFVQGTAKAPWNSDVPPMPRFTWPVEETVPLRASISIPQDLFN